MSDIFCQVCIRFVEPGHECPVASELSRKRDERERSGKDPSVFWLAMKARPTRTMVP